MFDSNDLNDLPKLDDLNEWSIPFRKFRIREKFTIIFRFPHNGQFPGAEELREKLYDSWLPDTLRGAQMKE